MNAPVYSCIIVDDDEIDRLTTYAYVKKFPFLDVRGQYASAAEALGKLAGLQVDVLISDIDMPGMNGLDFRAHMMQIPACVFVTAFPDYAAEGFEAEAFDFLIKPLRKDRVDQCMSRLEAFLEMKRKAGLFDHSLGGDTVYIKDGHDQIKIKLHEVIYLEALKDYTRIVTTTRKYCVLASIGNLLMETSFQSFLRIHRSYAVQRHYIDRITAQQVYVREYTLPVGRSYKDVLQNLK